MRTILPIAVVASLGFAASAAAEKITYDDHVRPIFENKCFSCHNPDKAKGGLDLTSYGATLAGGSSGQIALSGEPGNSKLYTVVTHAEEPIMPPKGGKIADASIDTLAKWLSGGLLETTSSTAKKAQKPAFSMALDGAPVGKPEGPPPMPEKFALPLEPVVVTPRGTVVADIATSPWAPLIAVTGQKQVILHHSDTLEPLGVLAYPEGFPQSLTFSRNGKLVVAGGGRHGKSGNVVAWDVTTGERVLELGNEFDAVLAADINPAQTRVALGGPLKKVKLLDTTSGRTIKTIEKHTEWITALAFSPDGKFLATADRNGGVLVWEGDTGNEVHTLDGHKFAVTDLAWRPDSKGLVTSSDNDGQVMLWEMKEGKRVKNWGAHGGGTLSVQYSSKGEIVTAGRDNRARIWKGDGAKLRDLEPAPDLFTRASFNHDGTRAFAADWNGQLHAYNPADGKRTAQVGTNPPGIATRIHWAAEGLKKAEATLAAAKQAEAGANKAVADRSAQIKANDEAEAKAKAALAEHQKQLAAHSAEQDKLTAEHRKVSAETGQLDGRLKAAGRTVSDSKAALDQTGKALADLDAKIDDARNKLEAAPGPEKPAAQNVLDALTKQRQTASAEVEQHQDTHTTAMEQRDQFAAQRRSISEQLAGIEQRRNAAGEKLSAARAAVEATKKALPGFPKKRDELNKALAAAKKQQGEAAAATKAKAELLDAARASLEHWKAAAAAMAERAKAQDASTAAAN